jgi:transketolase
MLLYSALHLTGTSLSLEDLRAFRQWGSRTAGHPEYGEAPGIETTTGPLGQGFANGVGMALAERWLSARFGPLFDHRTWVLCGDGCLMEGISQEAASLAGHLGLGRLICVYDDNNITIDGTTALSFSEDVGARFVALGWHVQRVDGHDHSALRAAFAAARAEGERPSLICARTVIARGAPRLAGSNKSHGAPLGKEEVAATKAALGLDPERQFDVPEEVRTWFQRRNPALQAQRLAWEQRLAAHPEQARIRALLSGEADLSNTVWPSFAPGSQVATRKASELVLQALAAAFEGLVGGSADLAESNGTYL